MKRFFSIFLAVLFIVMSIPFAFALNYEGFVLNKDDKGNYVITECKIFSDSIINVPESVNGIPVTAIGSGAFRSKSNIYSVTIPDSVTSIGSMAFMGCKNLTDIEIGEGVTSIGAKAFSSCSSLSSIDVKNTTMIGEYVFAGCKSLGSFSAESGLKIIGRSAFEGCASLDYVNLGDALVYIDKLAFSGCESLQEIFFPDTLAFIGERAFSGCTSLSDVHIGSGELQIEAYAFENCSSLSEITIPDNVTSIGENAFAVTNTENLDVAYYVTICCNKNSPVMPYVKASNVSVYIMDEDVTISVFGDMNGNGEVDTEDAATALDITAGIEVNNLSDYEMFLYDLDCNNAIDTDDVILMLKKAANVA